MWEFSINDPFQLRWSIMTKSNRNVDSSGKHHYYLIDHQRRIERMYLIEIIFLFFLYHVLLPILLVEPRQPILDQNDDESSDEFIFFFCLFVTCFLGYVTWKRERKLTDEPRLLYVVYNIIIEREREREEKKA
jgi:hypothetical protein